MLSTGSYRRLAVALIIALDILCAIAAISNGPLVPAPRLTSAQPMRCAVDARAPETGVVRVRLVVPADALRGASCLTLRIPDLGTQPQALRQIAARSENGQSLLVWRPFWWPANERRIQFLGARGSVTIEYTIDPLFYPPGSGRAEIGDARSRITPTLAVLRTASFLPQIEPQGLAMSLAFDLPDGWQAVTPWRQADGGFMLSPQEQAGVEYIGLGPWHVDDMLLDTATVRLATVPLEGGLPAGVLLRVLGAAADAGGPLPGGGQALRAVLVIPRGFFRGGAAGARTVVQPPSPIVLAHEIFHWWNGGDLTAGEAAWFREGFTTYYGTRLAGDSALLSQDGCRECLADLEAEMRLLEGDQPRSLAGVSRQMADDRASRLVYSKGALFALLLERTLQAQGRSLDEAMRAAAAEGRTGLGNDDLRALFHRVYGGAVDDLFDRYVLEANPLPDLGLPEATGRSGCARYLPSP